MPKDAFITPDFLLQSKPARRLYHEYAEDLPIIDYHCHLPAGQIADDHRFANVTEIWLAGDHYKWRAMRANGVAERFCSGDASGREKFQKWAETVPATLGNPLYHWTHLELARCFGIGDRLLNPKTAKTIWEECNRKLAAKSFSARGILKRMNVVLVCTTDDPTDSLASHRRIASDAFDVKVLPAWRPTKGMTVESPEAFNAWVDKLAAAANVHIKDFESYLAALRKRHEFFHQMGCRLSDHALETGYAEEYTAPEITRIFRNVRSGRAPAPTEVLKFKSAMMHQFGMMDWKKDWTQQYHIGALRNVNARMMRRLGPDTGFDVIGNLPVAHGLAGLLDRLERDGKLPKTILYNLDPADNAVMAALTGSFQDGVVPGKLQWGSAWWFLDQKDGIEAHLRMLGNIGLLSRFVGMTTDSRSFLSCPRHEYFHRVLCNMLGSDIEAGLLPRDFTLVGGMVRDICYNNARSYFGFGR